MPSDRTIYNWSINNTYIPLPSFVMSNVFDMTHIDTAIAPIDKFISKNTELNKLLINPNNALAEIEKLQRGKRIKKYAFERITNFIKDPNNVSPVLANLVLLGHISAVESYFREMFKRVILIDEVAQESCRQKEVSYSAALAHKPNTLPDALLEQITFLGTKNITESLRDYLGVRGELPNSVKKALSDYSKICQLRHCIVHRFGILGVNNAIKLNWNTHKNYVDKPIKINFNSLQEVSQICYNLIKEINNYIWQHVMMRQIADGFYNNFSKKGLIVWTWIWRTDKNKFKKYFDIFFSTLAPPLIIDMRQAYNEYKTKYTLLP